MNCNVLQKNSKTAVNDIERLTDNYEAFYLMTRLTAFLGSSPSERLFTDAQHIIDFIGHAYLWKPELINTARDYILGDMMKVGLTDDYNALAAADRLAVSERELLILYEIKGRAIESVIRAEAWGNNSNEHKTAQEIRSCMNYAAFHHEYVPSVRFYQIKDKAESGEISCCLQIAVMLLLGIGCKTDLPSAQRLLQRLLIWGEKAAARLLAFLWECEGDYELSAFYSSVYERTDIIGSDLSDIPANVYELCTLIFAVKSQIIGSTGKSGIDFIFADILNSEDIPFKEKLSLIRHYREGIYTNYYITDSARQNIGFFKVKNT